jgi:hypothetical protein
MPSPKIKDASVIARHRCSCGICGNPSAGGAGIDLFANPTAVCGEFRCLILGYRLEGHTFADRRYANVPVFEPA